MSEHLKFQLEPDDQERLNRLCGPTNSTLKQIEEILRIKISNRGMKFKVRGEAEVIKTAEFLLKDLYERLDKGMRPGDLDTAEGFMATYDMDKDGALKKSEIYAGLRHKCHSEKRGMPEKKCFYDYLKRF